jgi:hypothetical protein
MSHRLRTLLDRITRRISAFANFQELIDAHPSYTPSIYPLRHYTLRRRLQYRCLARQYDLAQANRNDPRRCYQGQSQFP